MVASKAGSSVGADLVTIIPFPQWRVSELYPHIGRVAIEWGFLDFAIMAVSSMMFSNPEVAKREKVAPRALKRRLQLVGRSVREVGELSAFQAEAEALVERVRTLMPLRDSVIHSYPGHYEVETGRIVFHGLDIDDNQTGHDLEDEFITIQDLIGLGLAVHRLAADFSQFGHKLIVAGVVSEKSEEPGGYD